MADLMVHGAPGAGTDDEPGVWDNIVKFFQSGGDGGGVGTAGVYFASDGGGRSPHGRAMSSFTPGQTQRRDPRSDIPRPRGVSPHNMPRNLNLANSPPEKNICPPSPFARCGSPNQWGSNRSPPQTTPKKPHGASREAMESSSRGPPRKTWEPGSREPGGQGAPTTPPGKQGSSAKQGAPQMMRKGSPQAHGSGSPASKSMPPPPPPAAPNPWNQGKSGASQGRSPPADRLSASQRGTPCATSLEWSSSPGERTADMRRL
jgi:hypothetical protein